MNNSGIVNITTTFNDVPHLATTLWFAGCKLDCQGCHNSILESFQKGMDINTIEKELIERRGMTEWLVYLGGNPLDSIESLLLVSSIAKRLDYKQFLYSGYTFDEFQNMFDLNIHTKLIDNFDYIKTGRYDHSLSKSNCSDVGTEYFFETLNQEVYKKEEHKWEMFYNFNFNENRIFGNLNLI